MKLNINEYEFGFFLELEAETSQDAALLVRLGMNSTKALNVATHATKVGVCTQITIGNRKNPESCVKK